MKKRFVVICALSLMLSAGCTKQQNSSMSIQPSKLSQEETDIKNLLDPENQQQIFDYNVDEQVKSVALRVYRLKDGKWEMEREGAVAMSDLKGRFVVGFDKMYKGANIVFKSEHLKNSSVLEASADDTSFDDLGTTTNKISGETNIEYEKDIPLAIQYFSSKPNIEAYGVEDFSHPEKYDAGHEAVYAVTICFSKKELSSN